MTVQQLNAPSPARPGRCGPGVDHVVERHHERFTVVGNHLAQHTELSLTAIGLATHIQSLPDGARIGIKALTARFPEGEIRIAAALRELETHGYLARTRERLPSGRIVTRTVSYNRPKGADRARGGDTPRGAAVQAPPPPAPPPPPPRREPVLVPAPVPAPTPDQKQPAPAPDPAPAPASASAPLSESDPLRRAAAELLAGLREFEPRLLLTEADVRQLVPAVALWLERGVDEASVRRVLTTDLPKEPVRRPGGFVARRLAVALPPPLPAPRSAEPVPACPRVHVCLACDRGYRSTEPGRCGECVRAGRPPR